MEEGLYALLMALFLLFAPSGGSNSSSGDGIAQNSPAQEEQVSTTSLPPNPQNNMAPVEITASPSNSNAPTTADGNGDPSNAGGNGSPSTTGGSGNPTSTAGGSGEEQGGATTSQPSETTVAQNASPAVPTPAMLPALLGFSARMLKKKQKPASLPEQSVASA